MKKNTFNILISIFSFTVLMTMISTGLILKFILPPGSGRPETLMRGGRHFEKTIDLLMGLSRHEWGQIHLYIALTFLALIVIRIILHWNWIKTMTFGTKTNPQPFRRKSITVGVIIFILLVLIFPWLMEKKSYTYSEYQQLGTEDSSR
jgi:hypothetical protein